MKLTEGSFSGILAESRLLYCLQHEVPRSFFGSQGISLHRGGGYLLHHLAPSPSSPSSPSSHTSSSSILLIFFVLSHFASIVRPIFTPFLPWLYCSPSSSSSSSSSPCRLRYPSLHKVCCVLDRSSVSSLNSSSDCHRSARSAQTRTWL